jgi:type II secretory pathway component PulF
MDARSPYFTASVELQRAKEMLLRAIQSLDNGLAVDSLSCMRAAGVSLLEAMEGVGKQLPYDKKVKT